MGKSYGIIPILNLAERNCEYFSLYVNINNSGEICTLQKVFYYIVNANQHRSSNAQEHHSVISI